MRKFYRFLFILAIFVFVSLMFFKVMVGTVNARITCDCPCGYDASVNTCTCIPKNYGNSCYSSNYCDNEIVKQKTGTIDCSDSCNYDNTKVVKDCGSKGKICSSGKCCDSDMGDPCGRSYSSCTAISNGVKVTKYYQGTYDCSGKCIKPSPFSKDYTKKCDNNDNTKVINYSCSNGDKVQSEYQCNPGKICNKGRCCNKDVTKTCGRSGSVCVKLSNGKGVKVTTYKQGKILCDGTCSNTSSTKPYSNGCSGNSAVTYSCNSAGTNYKKDTLDCGSKAYCSSGKCILYCGDGKIEDSKHEQCDPGNGNGAVFKNDANSCSDYDQNREYDTKDLICTKDCKVDISNCPLKLHNETKCSDNSPGACCSNGKSDAWWYHCEIDANGARLVDQTTCQLFDPKTCLNTTACTDCQDLDCNGVDTPNGKCEFKIEKSCHDGFDNNGNGLTDCEDPSCGSIHDISVQERAKKAWDGHYYKNNMTASCCYHGVGCITPDGKCVDSGVYNGYICINNSGNYIWESVFDEIGFDLYGIAGNQPKKILCSKKNRNGIYYLNLKTLFPRFNQNQLDVIENNTFGLCLLSYGSSDNPHIVVSFIENQTSLGNDYKSVIPLFSKREKANVCNKVTGNDFVACGSSGKIWYDSDITTVIISSSKLDSITLLDNSFNKTLKEAAKDMFDAKGMIQNQNYPIDYKYLFLSSDGNKKIVSSVLSYNQLFYSYLWYDNVPCVFCNSISGSNNIISSIMPPATCNAVSSGVQALKSFIIVDGGVLGYSNLMISDGVWSGMSYLYPFNR